MLKLVVTIEMPHLSDITHALERVSDMIDQGYTSTAGFEGMHFELNGEEEPFEDED